MKFIAKLKHFFLMKLFKFLQLQANYTSCKPHKANIKVMGTLGASIMEPILPCFVILSRTYRILRPT